MRGYVVYCIVVYCWVRVNIKIGHIFLCQNYCYGLCLCEMLENPNPLFVCVCVIGREVSEGGGGVIYLNL